MENAKTIAERKWDSVVFVYLAFWILHLNLFLENCQYSTFSFIIVLSRWLQIKWQWGYIFQDVKISGWNVNHPSALSKWCQTQNWLETTLMFGVIETKQPVDHWIVHLSMGCLGNTRVLLKSPFSLGGLELWFQLSIIFQINHRKFAKPGLSLGGHILDSKLFFRSTWGSLQSQGYFWVGTPQKSGNSTHALSLRQCQSH